MIVQLVQRSEHCELLTFLKLILVTYYLLGRMSLIAEELSSTEKTIYVYLIEQGKPTGVRDIARALNMPVSTVHYNLRKLMEKNLVVKTIEGYVARKINPPEGFILIGYNLVPRLLLYAAFYFGATIASAILLFTYWSIERLMLFLLSLIAFTVFLIEGVQARKALYRRRKKLE